MKISVVSGGFDPLHSGHLAYIKAARNFGDKLIVLLNSDHWLTSKKGKFFLPFSERKVILKALKDVDQVIAFDDSDGSCINGLLALKEKSITEIIHRELCVRRPQNLNVLQDD